MAEFVDPFALTSLFDAVVAQFTADETPGAFWFGWNEPDKQKTGTRNVFFVPGDSSGNIGAILPPRNVGGNPRNLGVIDELATIIVDAYDPDNATNERAQYAAARLLFDDVFRALYLSAHGRMTIRRVAWMAEKKVRRKGAAIEILISVQGTLPDEASGLVGPGTDVPVTLAATVSELDQSTTITGDEAP